MSEKKNEKQQPDDEGGLAAFARRGLSRADAERMLAGRDRGNLEELVAVLALAEDPGPLLAALRVVIEAGCVLRDDLSLRWRDRKLVAGFAELELSRPDPPPDPLAGVTPPPDKPRLPGGRGGPAAGRAQRHLPAA